MTDKPTTADGYPPELVVELVHQLDGCVGTAIT